jgi:hypothetical protein
MHAPRILRLVSSSLRARLSGDPGATVAFPDPAGARPPGRQPPGGIADQRRVPGLLAAPGLLYELAQRLARELPGDLSARFTGFSWQFVVKEEVLAGPEGSDEDPFKIARKRLLDEEWKLASASRTCPCTSGVFR